MHKAAKVTVWVVAHHKAIEISCLPPYAPELNPGEHLNGDLTLGVARRFTACTRNELVQFAKSHLRMLQQRPERERRSLKHPRINFSP